MVKERVLVTGFRTQRSVTSDMQRLQKTPTYLLNEFLEPGPGNELHITNDDDDVSNACLLSDDCSEC